MTTRRYETAITAVLHRTPNPSPALRNYIDHLRAHAVLAKNADLSRSEKDFDAWAASVDDDSAWRALSTDEQRLFREQL